ncbi:MAG TPA: ribonuclease H-like domain-containing protein [Nitrospinota bacterium]|nr:ribonuclease H-like domain-containing protein [Nitrospinota bacterium]|tara:strand:+ start:24299 stop:24886 length:588 start_codon:yes stop_codon:yes gene_type:complete
MASSKRIIFFDLETQKGAEQVGGWENAHLMELAVAVLYDSIERKYTSYWEKDAQELINILLAADLVVGFNHIKFDYSVLSGYTSIDLARETNSFDILADIKDRLNFRIGLNRIAQATLGKVKTADGLTSLLWWADGKHEKVADYCQMDVEITKEVFEYGLQNKKLLYKTKNGDSAQLSLDWDLDKIISEAGKDQG